MKLASTRAAALAFAGLLPLLPGCGGTSVNAFLFGGIREQDVSRAPAGATTYRCEAGKRFFVRYLDGAAWVILPDREFRLDKVVSASGERYSNGNSTFEITGSAASLSDGATVTHNACKAATD